MARASVASGRQRVPSGGQRRSMAVGLERSMMQPVGTLVQPRMSLQWTRARKGNTNKLRRSVLAARDGNGTMQPGTPYATEFERLMDINRAHFSLGTARFKWRTSQMILLVFITMLVGLLWSETDDVLHCRSGDSRSLTSEWCPSAADMGFDYNEGGGIIQDGAGWSGWMITGGARVHTKAAYNVLGGFIEFDIDVSHAHVGVNANVYGITPQLVHGYSMKQYCDGAKDRNTWCAEHDFIEANGNCGSSTALHTVPNEVGGCDANGCTYEIYFKNTTSFRVRIDFSDDGKWTHSQGDVSFSDTQLKNELSKWRENKQAYAGDKDAEVVAAALKTRGYVIQSSQWTGWAPLENCTGKEKQKGDLGTSTFSVKNLKIKGKIVQGPTPRACKDIYGTFKETLVA